MGLIEKLICKAIGNNCKVFLEPEGGSRPFVTPAVHARLQSIMFGRCQPLKNLTAPSPLPPVTASLTVHSAGRAGATMQRGGRTITCHTPTLSRLVAALDCTTTTKKA